jgi:hypothetical protein
MDAKITLSFDEAVIVRAKQFAEANNISLSRLTEFLLNKATAASYPSLDELPVSSWVTMVAEGRPNTSASPAPARLPRPSIAQGNRRCGYS